MSHFTVLVIGPNVEKQLQPFHEFECTGIEDEYVVDVDKTAEALADYDKGTIGLLRDPRGALHEKYDEAGEYKPEFSKPGQYGRRELFIPDGWEEVRVPAKDHQSAADYISGWYGWGIMRPGDAMTEELKFGRIEVDADGNVARCIDRTNPNKQWDWWVVGGRWAGFFKLKPGASGQRGRSGLMGSCANEGEGYADSVRKGDIDVQGMRDDAAREAGESWDKVRAVTGDLADFKTWAEMREAHPGNSEAARAAYHAQRARVALNECGDRDMAWVDLDDYRVTREEYTKSAADGALSTFAVLKDGQWHERGSMGWWGCVSDEKDKDEWRKQFASLIDGLPDDTLLTVVDCHI